MTRLRTLARTFVAVVTTAAVAFGLVAAGGPTAAQATYPTKPVRVIESAPDGHTLMLAANAIAANPTLYQPSPFDPLRDLTAVSLVGRVPVVFAGPQDRFGALLDSEKARYEKLIREARIQPD